MGAGKSEAHCGTGSVAFGIKGLAARIYFAFTHSSPLAPAVASANPSPALMARIIRGRKGDGARRARHSGTIEQRARPCTAQIQVRAPEQASGNCRGSALSDLKTLRRQNCCDYCLSR